METRPNRSHRPRPGAPQTPKTREDIHGTTLLKLDRYAASARRSWHKSLDTLLTLRAAMAVSDVRYSRVRRNLSDMAVNEVLSAPLPGEPVCFAQLHKRNETKPIPTRFHSEIAFHQRRDPNFDLTDSEKLSPEFRKWLDAA